MYLATVEEIVAVAEGNKKAENIILKVMYNVIS